MADRDTQEFLAAFFIGALLGVGATLLLRPDPPTRRERLAEALGPARKRARRAARRARKGMEGGLESARERGGDAFSGGRERLSDFREEVAGIVASARDELTRAVEKQVGEVDRALGRLRRS